MWLLLIYSLFMDAIWLAFHTLLSVMYYDEILDIGVIVLRM